MDRTPLYQAIAESIRSDILRGVLSPGDELPNVRQMAVDWGCSPGTVLRAYQKLAEQGLIISRPGAGTRVAEGTQPQTPLRQAELVNQTETFLLGMLGAGHTVEDITRAFRIALDRWRALSHTEEPAPVQGLRFVGSHDPALALLHDHLAGRVQLKLTFAGSLGGLMALAQGEAEIAGVHLWDAETDIYNRPFVRRLLPGQRVALLTLAERHIGLIVAAGNPLNLTTLADLTGLRFINRQSGAGTRVWLDAQLGRLGLPPEGIDGYQEEALTHSEVANAVHEGRADVGLGIETAALAYGLGFIPLTTERYDLVISEALWQREPVQALVAAVTSPEMKAAISTLGGYDVAHTGHLEWVI